MINIAATVKYYCRDAFFDSPFSNKFANQFSCFSIAAFDILSLDFLVQRAGGNQGYTVDIINDLCINIGKAAENVQTRTFCRAVDVLT